MPISSQKEAHEFIAKLREGNGGITVETREFLAASCPSALRALQQTRRQLADSIKILVDNLYSRKTRFLYELIQNAEDNSYSTAVANNENPFLAFKLLPNRIIIDSNEDGFSEDNIKAICSVARSTKKHSAGYIGEKGIGFKSVFKIAQKVHIQSGPFSFAFLHTREDDDDGLGMITPFHESSEELPVGVRTRMTLTLLDSIKFKKLASKFQGIPDTVLMFLSRLERLSIELYQPDNTHTTIQYSKRETEENGLYTTFLAKTTREDTEESVSEQKYYTTKSEVDNLPFDEARKDKEGNSIDRTTVVLAFPVDEHDEPFLEKQYTYAFLPLRRVGFNFLIQADFITQANREDVVHTTRNHAVLRGVAKAFVNTVTVLRKRPSLRYRWMRYLPANSITDDFWMKLWLQIRDTLEQTPILESWTGKGLYKPSKLEKLSENLVAEDQTPLLRDIKGAEVYLSPKYTDSDFQTLTRLGTTTLHLRKFIDRLEADLRNAAGSKWRVLENNDDWRTRICKVLLSASVADLPQKKKRFGRLALIPLSDGRWVSGTSETEIYFPKTVDVPIPVDLGFNIICPIAAENVVWTDLLSYLGVKTCPRESVLLSIHSRYAARNFNKFKVANAVAHIRYLYWFLPKERFDLASRVRLANQHDSLLKQGQYLYFPDVGDDYSPSELFRQDVQLPGHPVNFLNEAYLKAVDPVTIHLGRSWVKWLEDIVGVYRIPKLCADGHDGLSSDFRYIVRHRSDRLLGTLKRGWDSYQSQLNDVVKTDLRKSAVLLENRRKASLAGTFLPSPGLKKIATELLIANEFPFIAVSELLRDEDRLVWMFVKHLQVGIEEDLDFYLTALETFKESNPVLTTSPPRDPLTRIYKSIQSRCSECLDRVREVFGRSVIWIPPPNRIDSSWLSIANCVWDGPQWLRSKQSLKLEVYLELEPLFKTFLKIADVSQVDVINDLLMLKSHDGNKDIVGTQPVDDTQQSVGTISTSCQVGNPQEKFQSITVMEGYEKHSFEEHRLQDYKIGRKPLRKEPSVCKSKTFAGLQLDQVVEEVEKRYKYLWQKHPFFMNDENPESGKAMRFAFEHSALVYVPQENSWYPPSRCVWAESNVKIPGKASIADVYPLLERFFIEVLSVSKPTVNMYVDSMKAEAKGKASAVRIKETMRLICSLGVGEHDLTSLAEAKVLPIKLANGVGGFASASSTGEYVDFAIVENTIHRDAFEGKIIVLDLSLEEIRDTRPLLLAMGLKDRFSSKLVKEVTHVTGGCRDHGMTKSLRTKSHAIVRCAFHFSNLDKRLDVASLYRKFKRATVYVSEGIRRSLQMMQEGRRIESASSRADFHFEEVDHALRLYLPKDEAERDVCFESDLPRRLCTFLGLADPVALAVIGSVFRKDNPDVIGRILEKAGVSQTDCDFDALDEQLTTSGNESDTETLVDATSNSRLSTPDSDPRPYTPSSGARWRQRNPGGESLPHVRDEIMPSSSGPERQAEAQEAAYNRILEHVVDVARQRVFSGVLESTESSTRDTIATEALPGEIFQTAFISRTQERDFKIGAAGELYMFEYLKGLGLPRFDLRNWKSEIRDRVKIHADYHDIEKYSDRSAIADIEYLDDSGTLTRFLTQKGHLAQGLWQNEKPLYHIEVKTTTSSNWQEPFFMSKAQEQHIHNKRIENGKTRSSIYMICRIFNLGKGDETGLHVYLDPETKRRNQELEFRPQTWAVKPLRHLKLQVANGAAKSAARTTAMEGTISYEKSSNNRSNDSKKESGVPRSAVFGSSTSNTSVPRSGDTTSAPSTLVSQVGKKSTGGSLFDFTSNPFLDKASTRTPSNGGLFGKTKFTPSSIISFGSTIVPLNSDKSTSQPRGLFGSSAITLKGNTSNSTTKAGLVGSIAMSANDPDSDPGSISPILDTLSGPFFKFSFTPPSPGTTANSNTSKWKSPSAARSSTLASSASIAIAGASFANGSSTRTGSDSSETTDKSSLGGTATQPKHSATAGSVFESAAQSSSSATTGFMSTVAQTSSSITVDSLSGERTQSRINSTPSQYSTIFSGLRALSSPSTNLSGTGATTPTSLGARKYKVPKTPTASTNHKAPGKTPTLTASSSTGPTETAKTSTSTSQDSLAAADLAPTDNPFQASSLPNKNNVSAPRSPSPSPPPAQVATREASPLSATADAGIRAAGTKLAITGDDASDGK